MLLTHTSIKRSRIWQPTAALLSGVPQTEEPTGHKGSGTTERPHKQTKWFKKTHLTWYLTNSKQTNKQKTTNALVPELLKLRPCGTSSDHTQPGAQERTNDQRCKPGLSTGWQAQIQKRRNQSTGTRVEMLNAFFLGLQTQEDILDLTHSLYQRS